MLYAEDRGLVFKGQPVPPEEANGGRSGDQPDLTPTTTGSEEDDLAGPDQSPSLTPQEVYADNCGVTSLFEQLQAVADQTPYTMEHRYGAWCRLLFAWRWIYEGGTGLPARHGVLLDPDQFPFLEGQPAGCRFTDYPFLDQIPRVSNGVLLRVLCYLMVPKGERLSYRTLDVEDIGAVYENLMGFVVERARGMAVGLRSQAVVVELADLLHSPNRAKFLKEQAGAPHPARC